jgi:hypothetical protein
MSSICPFNTSIPQNLKITSVPVNTTTDIPFVPKPYSGVSYQMGGTTPSYNSINNSKGFYSNNIYQISPPHSQNTLTPCSVIGKNPYNLDGPRKCFNVYSPGQNMIGRVCTTPGTDGPLYSREPNEIDNISNNIPDINGNADWVRGNQFAVSYDENKINNRTKYYYDVPVLKEEKKTYVNYDQFYPVPDRCMWNNSAYKEYPHKRNYTNTGYPTWVYPYETTQPNSINPTKIFKDENQSNEDYIEDFSNMIYDTSTVNVNKTYFWVGTTIILISILCCNKIIKH